MPAYVILFKFTDEGIRTVKAFQERVRTAKNAAEATGGRIIGSWSTLGQYDAVAISEFPDDEAVARFLLTGETQGDIRSETMRAFGEEEMTRILRGLP